MKKIIYIILILILVLNYQKILMSFLFNDFYVTNDTNYMYKFINNTYKNNKFYNKKYNLFFRNNKECNSMNFKEIPFLTKDELIKFNDDIISYPFKKCILKCINGCVNDPVFHDSNCSIGQSTGGTSGKNTFIWMDRYSAYKYIYTFIYSFKKNGYSFGDKMMIFYPKNSYFTNEYEKSNYYLSFLNIYFLSFDNIDKEKTIEFVNSINKNNTDFIVIFPFVLLQLCINIYKYDIKLTHYPKNINLSGEFVLNCSLNFCKRIFIDSNIENTYGAVEFGEIAHQMKGDKNTFEVFNKFCYLENEDDKIVVTSLINNSFPIIRYVMEDVGTIINKNGKQYIKNLIGKNTNQIIINQNKFTSLDIDRLIDFVNINNNIISIIIEYDNTMIDVNYIILNNYITEERKLITSKTYEFMNKYFNNMKYNIYFMTNFKHNYLKKFKIIVKKNNIDDEPVGGYFKYK
jgi:phenylacetate-coenzyme A ligase PaaK-like adenylate-forming protein